MAVDVIVPEVGEVEMAITLVRWRKGDGDAVRSGDVLFELDTEKSIVEVEAYADGTLTDVRAREGDPVSPHQVVARILEAGEVSPPLSSPASEPGGALPVGTNATVATTEVGDRRARPRLGDPTVGASPRARRAAAEAGIQLAQVTGSGPKGLVSERDIQAAIVARDAASSAPSLISAAATASAGRTERTRRAVAELTSSSWRTVPHFYLDLHADVTQALQRVKPTALVLVAVARALMRHPECNVAWRDEALVEKSTIDLGLLVDTPNGLMLATIRDADRLDLGKMQEAVEGAVARARAGVLEAGDFVFEKPHDLQPRDVRRR